LLFSGCIYYPCTYLTLDADRIQQPFTDLWLVADPGTFSVSIRDSKRDLSELQVLRASFQNQSGQKIPITKVVYDEHYGKNFAIVIFCYKNGAYLEGTPFTVALDLSVDGEPLSVRGSYSMHAHTKMVYLPEVLDHG
jgi:hypothetical protein